MNKRAQAHAPLTSIEAQRIVSLREASRLAGVSIDTLRKHYRDRLVRVGPKRVGMRLGDVLSLGQAV